VLERVRFTTTDPAKLAVELDRFVLKLQDEFATLRRFCAERYIPAPTVSGKAGGAVAMAVASFGTIVPVNSANGDVDIALPSAQRSDAGRSLLVERLSTSNVVRIQAGTRLVNNDAPTVTLPTTRAAYIVTFDGIGFWTVNDA